MSQDGNSLKDGVFNNGDAAVDKPVVVENQPTVSDEEENVYRIAYQNHRSDEIQYDKQGTSSIGVDEEEGEEEDEDLENVEEADEETYFDSAQEYSDQGEYMSEELIPIRLDLKEGNLRLQDQFLWPVVMPVDLHGQNLSAYIEYNNKNIRIDQFATRIAEDLDYPISFEDSVARSMRAQIAVALPVLWKERQLTQHQDSHSLKQGHKSGQHANFNAEAGIPSSLNPKDDFPLNAINKLLHNLKADKKHTTTTSTVHKETESSDEEIPDLASSENLRKRKRTDMDETGKKKRKRGSAFEAHDLVDERILIRINLSLCGVQFKDQFEWDPSTPLFWADIFSRRLASEVGLPREMEGAIAFEIRRQVLGYMAASAHHLPLDWPICHSATKSLSKAQSLNKSSSINRNQFQSNETAYIPTRSLPVLTLQSVFRPPSVLYDYNPSLSDHPSSLDKWEASLDALENKE